MACYNCLSNSFNLLILKMMCTSLQLLQNCEANYRQACEKGTCLNELLMYGRTKCGTNALCFPVSIGHKPGGVQLSSNGWCQVWSGILETWVRNHSPGKLFVFGSFTLGWRESSSTNP